MGPQRGGGGARAIQKKKDHADWNVGHARLATRRKGGRISWRENGPTKRGSKKTGGHTKSLPGKTEEAVG